MENKKVLCKMENNGCKKACIKNRRCHCINGVTKSEHFNLDNILIDEKSQENILIYNISYKISIDSKTLLLNLIFDHIDGFIRIYNGTRYLALFGKEEYEVIQNRIRHLISRKSRITFIITHYFSKLKVDSCDSLPAENMLTLHTVIIHIKPVLDKDKNHYYSKTFFEKCSYQLD